MELCNIKYHIYIYLHIYMYDNMEAVCWLCIPGNWNIFPSLDEMEYDRDSFQVNIAHQQNRVGASKIFELLYRQSLERKAPHQSKDLEVSSKRSAPKSSIYRWFPSYTIHLGAPQFNGIQTKWLSYPKPLMSPFNNAQLWMILGSHLSGWRIAS